MKAKTRDSQRTGIALAAVICLLPFLASAEDPPILNSDWMDPARIMVIYNTVKMDSVDPAEPATFSHDMGEWYMNRYGMPTNHLFGFNMGTKVKWNNPGAYDFLQVVADYIETNNIQVVLMAPGTPMIIRDINNNADLALDSLAGHALWFAHVKQEAPACDNKDSIAPTTCNLYFPYVDMGDGTSPFVMLTKDATRWCPGGGSLIGSRQWYDTMMVDLRNHPSVRPFGRIGLPYYLEAFPSNDTNGIPIAELQIPLENTAFVTNLVNGGIAATTSIADFNAQTTRSLVFHGRENNTASFIDVESALNEAMAQDAIIQGVSPDRMVRIFPRTGPWDTNSCIAEPTWDYTHSQFQNGLISPGLNALILSEGGVGNTTEDTSPWPNSLDVQPGLVASVSVSNGKAFAGSLMRRGATTIVVNIHHPKNSRLHAWFSIHRQLINGATVAEAMVTGGGSERGGYISGSVWGDPLYAPFGENTGKENWFIGGSTAPAAVGEFTHTIPNPTRVSLIWTPVHLAAGYHIERRAENGGFEAITNLPVPATTFNDDTVSSDSGYDYRIRAYNTAGDSGWAQLRVATPPPDVTAVLTTDNPGNADATVQADFPDMNFGSHELLSVGGGITNGVTPIQKAYLRFDLNGLPDLNTARLDLTVVEARDFDSSYYLGSLVLLDESSDTWDESTITWSNAPQNNTTGGGFTAPATAVGTTFFFNSSIPAPGDILSTTVNAATLNTNRGANGLATFGIYQLASGNLGTVDFAAREHATYSPPTLRITHSPLQPARPLFLTADPGSATNIVLEWFDNADDETGFEVERRVLGGSSFAPVQTLGINATAFTNAVPLPGVVYEYRARATGSPSNSSWSLIASAAAPGTATSYQLWLQTVGLPMDGSGAGAPAAIPVDDNLANLIKYGLGLDSIHIGNGGRITYGIFNNGGTDYLTLIYSRPEPAPPEIIYTVEVGDDLHSWSAGGVIESSVVSNGMRTVTAHDLTPVSNAWKRFIRLLISQP